MPRILFLAANPDNADTLLAGDELRQIEAALQHTRFEVIAKPAAHLGDLRSLLRQYKPQIVHFSGHGSAYGELMFVDDQGNSQSATVSALATLFKLFNEHLRCVVLNACYSDQQATAIAAEIDCVLGFEAAIRDDAARAFLRAFYSTLAAGESIAVAKAHGINEVELHYAGAVLPCQIGGRAGVNGVAVLDR